jgi:hypothetical protein
MRTKFTVQLEFVLRDETAAKAIEIARQAYTSMGRSRLSPQSSSSPARNRRSWNSFGKAR